MSNNSSVPALTDLTSHPGARVKYPFHMVEQILAGAGVLDAFPHVSQGADAFVCQLDDETTAGLALECLAPFTTDLGIFGASVATSALDRLLAVGARPCAALNLLSFPCSMEASEIGAMLASAQKVWEVHGGAIVGGHTVEDKAPKFGIFAFGLIEPGAPSYGLAGAQPQDAIVITKPLGAQLLCAYHAQGELADEFLDAAATNMTTSALVFAQAFADHQVHAVACIGAGGLLSATERMAQEGTEALTPQIDAGRLPMLAGVVECALVQAQRMDESKRQGRSVETIALQTVLEDPGVSGGLVMAMPKKEAERMTSTIGGRIIGNFEAAK